MANDITMTDSPATDNTTQAFNSLFHMPSHDTLPPDVLGELQSIGRIHSIDPQEVFYKWESYAMKMGAADTKLDLTSVRAFKVDALENLERASAIKTQHHGTEKKSVGATPRVSAAGGDDFLGMLEGVTPRTPAFHKRKAVADHTPAPAKSVRSARKSSPTDGRTPIGGNTSATAVPFSERQNAGQVIETLNSHLAAAEPPLAPSAQSRVVLKANTDLKKFYYKPLAMHQSEASEVLDDRIDDFMQIIQEHHSLDEAVFGNAASKSTHEIVAIGRIASDSAKGKLNEASMLLELSRRQGAGLRVPLKFSTGTSTEFFPGQIVAVRGTNASGEYFSVSEILDVPLLPSAASLPAALEESNARVGADGSSDLSIIVASGPYTADDNLDYEPFQALCDQAAETYADVLLLSGPFLDIEHPLIASGDFELPSSAQAEPDQTTLSDAFRHFISTPLRRLAQAHPSITIVLVPSTRDAVNKHTAWPQEPFTSLKKDLGLPKQVRSVTNPCTLSFNEIVLGISSQDILYDLRREELLLGPPTEANLLARLPKHLIRQRHFYPLYPTADRTLLPRPAGAAGAAGAAASEGADGTEAAYAIGTPLDPTYLKLAEWLHVRPDVLITPSALLPFAKVVDSVVVVNPGPTSKRRGAGTFAKFAVRPRDVSREERDVPDRLVGHRVFERARVDVVRI